MKASAALAMIVAPALTAQVETGASTTRYSYPDRLKHIRNRKVFYKNSKNDKSNYEEANFKRESNEKNDDVVFYKDYHKKKYVEEERDRIYQSD